MGKKGEVALIPARSRSELGAHRYWTEAMQDPTSELRRIPLPRTSVNKSKKKGRSRSSDPPQRATQVAAFVR